MDNFKSLHLKKMTDERSASWKALLENPYLINPPKNECQDDKKGEEWNENFDATVAFLGPTLWSKTLPFDDDFKVDYMDLDDLFDDKEANDRNGSGRKSRKRNAGTFEDEGCSRTSSNDSSNASNTKTENIHDNLHVHKKHGPKKVLQSEICFSPDDLALATFPGKDFDPSNKKFTDNELKPQPMFKKCKKQLVPNDMKDDHYWAQRLKNNIAAKRSRDARRIKENQIVMRAAFLEKENYVLKIEMEALRLENESLKTKLQDVTPS